MCGRLPGGASERLGWTAQQLHIAALTYGDLGTYEDVEEHLRTGDHLPPEKRAFVAAARWDAEVAELEE